MEKKAVGEQVIYPELSYAIIEIALEIHNTIGPGFTENIYETAFACELENHQILFEQQKPIQVFYKNHPVGVYRLDFLIDQKIIVELKAVNTLNDLFKQQLNSYLKAADLKLGLLINFGSKRLEHIRVVH